MKYEVKFDLDLGLSLTDNGLNYNDYYADFIGHISTLEGYINQYDCFSVTTLSADFAEVRSQIENDEEFTLPFTGTIEVSKIIEAASPYEAEDKVMDMTYCDDDWLDKDFFIDFLKLDISNYRVRNYKVYEYNGERLDTLTSDDFQDYSKFEDVVEEDKKARAQIKEMIENAIKEADEEYEQKNGKG